MNTVFAHSTMHVERVKPCDFHRRVVETDLLKLMEFQGVASRHRLYMDPNGRTMWYYVAPDGGPADWYKKWHRTPQRFDVFEYDDSENIADVETEIAQYVLAEAITEVRNEIS